MSVPEEPGFPELPQRVPMRELLLAQALDACITAERQLPGSSRAIIARQPAWARADLQRMMALAKSLDAAAASALMSAEFGAGARSRLMQRIGAEVAPEPVALIGPRLTALPSRNSHYPHARWRSRLLWRGSAGLLAAVLGVAATLTASASSLPGEPLYNLKQAQEELSVRLAPDDQTRALALLGRADARLDETARLLLQGRTDAALETTQRYGQVVERATTTYVITIDDSPEQAPGTLNLETRLTQQQEQLETIIQTAPEPARADLREALVTTERGRALVADPRPIERVLGRASSDRSAVAAPVPTTAAEDSPTVVPTRRPAPQPANVVVAQATEQPAEKPVVAQHGAEDASVHTQNNTTPNGGGRTQQPARPVVAEDQHGDEVALSPGGEGREDGGSAADRNGNNGSGRATPNGHGIPPTQADRPVVTQQNTGNEGDGGHGRSDDAPQPVIAHQAGAPSAVKDAPAGPVANDNKPAGGPARTTAPQVAAPGDKPSAGGRDNGDSPRAAPTPAARGQAVPTPTPGKRGGDGSDNARPTPAPSHSSPGDPTHPGGGGGGTDDHGHGGGGD